MKERVIALLETELEVRKTRASDLNRTSSYQPKNCKGCVEWLMKMKHRFLYALEPYNKSMWNKLRNIWWWVIKGLCCCSGLGVNSIMFTIILCLIDKGDDYQLIEFLMSFKQYQFWTVSSAVCFTNSASAERSDSSLLRIGWLLGHTLKLHVGVPAIKDHT